MKKEEIELWVLIGLFVVLAYTAGTTIENAVLEEAVLPTRENDDTTPPTPTQLLDPVSIAQIARIAGFSGNDLATAVAVAIAESSGNPNAVGDVGIGQGSFGLWQISSYYHPEFGPDFTKLFDPQTNAAAAFQIYREAKNTFRPWSTFKGGQYLQHEDVASAAVSQLA